MSCCFFFCFFFLEWEGSEGTCRIPNSTHSDLASLHCRPGRTGTMVPFALRVLHSELMCRLNNSQLTLDRLLHLLKLCRSELEALGDVYVNSLVGCFAGGVGRGGAVRDGVGRVSAIVPFFNLIGRSDSHL